VDFSGPADSALRYAIALAGELGARLVLTHVFQVPSYAFPDAVVPVPPETVDELRRSCEARLGILCRHAAASGVTAEPLLVEGSAFVEIIRAARKVGSDLIVMGTHGRTGLRHALLGSVAEKVVRKAPCPVLVVRPPEMPAFVPP
jgi:nucleotide-binding universal stress UspA family protein